MSGSTDFIVIGSGIAGLRAAIGLAPAGQVTILTKDRADESNTEYAQGGVAVVLNEEDDLAIHFEDTIKAGAGLCEPRAVHILVEDGPRYVTELIEWGAQFDRADGHLEFTREAAHSRRRILHAHGDSTGREIVRALLEKTRRTPNIQLLAHSATQSLIARDGRCSGVVYIDKSGHKQSLTAHAIVLATGGAGQIYSKTTNPEVATGDGMAMAYQAGATLRDMEFVQFHPTALRLPGAPNFLLSEAMRGEGGVLRNQSGERFMPRYTEAAELAPRDVVSRSIVAELEKTGTDVAFLDMRHLDKDFVKERFPNIYSTCLHYGLDITKDPIPVSPAAHYIMGGVKTDIDGRTDLPGLYAAGEVASTGVHGANRLASNSLLEGLVFGARAGIAARNESTGDRPSDEPSDTAKTDWHIGTDVKERVRELMWYYAAIVRDGRGLQEAVSKLEALLQSAEKEMNIATRNFVSVAVLIVKAAIERTESRGGHY
ncbi:MAG TPA: L-aspartate oxidase, partial [Blastocatellia bacterium]|nr:L-aspartate oxidase [Blastocatellia bacterium]